MKAFLRVKRDKLIQYLNAAYQLNFFLKTKYLLWLLLAIHSFLLLFFVLERIFLMCLLTMCGIFVYALCFLRRIRCNYRLLIPLASWEIIIVTVFTTLCIGWDSGFCLYLPAMIPVVYYLSYMADNFYNQKVYGAKYAILFLFVFLLLRLFSYSRPLLYPELRVSLMHSMYLINAFFSMAVSLFFMTIFSSTILKTENTLKIQNKKLLTLANIDSLTGFYNRRSMNEFLSNAIQSNAHWHTDFCVALGDIDNFKKINDTYGHECGDLVLQKIAQIMQTNVYESDCICRWGGEEILILFQNCSYEKAIRLTEKIRADVAAFSFQYHAHTISFSMTFGIHPYEPNCQASELINKADSKLYCGKQKGKNCVIS